MTGAVASSSSTPTVPTASHGWRWWRARPSTTIRPRPPGRWRFSKVPPLFTAALQLLRMESFRQARGGYGGMSVDKSYHLYDDLVHGWFAPALTDRAIRRDFIKPAGGAPGRRAARAGRGSAEVHQAGARRLGRSGHDDARRACIRAWPLTIPTRLEIVKDSSTLVPIDQPELLAGLLREFVLVVAAG